MNTFIIICRLIVGLVFIFSGFVKGVDPLGTAYRLDDYFIAFGTEWAMPLSLIVSILLSALEFVLGVILVFNARIRFFSWILFILILFFTLLTLNDAINNPVPDCGCFGDAIKLSNWETFYKNVVLIILASIIFFTRNKVTNPMSGLSQSFTVLFASGLFIFFEIYNIYYLPVIDFRDYKVGNNIAPASDAPPKVYVTYRNMSTGEEKEYLSPDYPWNDSIWMSEWEFVSQRSESTAGVSAYELKIEDEYGDDYTDLFLNHQGYQFLVIAYDLDKTSRKGFDKLKTRYDTAYLAGISMVVVTSSIPGDVEAFKEMTTDNFDYFFADDIVLKTIIRSNPGLILLRDGVVLEKWHYHDLPDYSELKSKYLSQ